MAIDYAPVVVEQETPQHDMSPFHFDGTLPLRLFDPTRFYGRVEKDGQSPLVAALACNNQEVVAIALVGYDTSVSAALAGLFSTGKGLTYLRPADCRTWRGGHKLERLPEHYRQFSTHLEGTREVYTVAIYETANIGMGIRNPADITEDPKEGDSELTISAIRKKQRNEAQSRSRYLFGHVYEETPHMRSFMGTLYAIRVIFLQHDDEHREWPRVWAEQLWQRGLERRMIIPLVNALGMKAWKVSGSTRQWSQLIQEGTREGWLPGKND